jgi:hypothetical protein
VEVSVKVLEIIHSYARAKSTATHTIRITFELYSIIRIVMSDSQAHLSFFLKQKSRLHRLAYKMTESVSDAEDVLNDVYISFSRQPKRLTGMWLKQASNDVAG